MKLLLLLTVRKGELVAARWDEFELDADTPVGHLPGERTKTGQPIDIPFPTMSVDWLRELHRLALDSDWVLPARKMQSRMLPYICESTIGVATGKVKHGLPHFTTHDFRRTARTHLAALGVDPHVGERCLKHKLKGVERLYNRHDYFDERKAALEAWSQLLLQFERGGNAKVLPIGRRAESKKASGYLRGVDPDTRPTTTPDLEPQGMSAPIDSPSPVLHTLTGMQSR